MRIGKAPPGRRYCASAPPRSSLQPVRGPAPLSLQIPGLLTQNEFPGHRPILSSAITQSYSVALCLACPQTVAAEPLSFAFTARATCVRRRCDATTRAEPLQSHACRLVPWRGAPHWGDPQRREPPRPTRGRRPRGGSPARDTPPTAAVFVSAAERRKTGGEADEGFPTPAGPTATAACPPRLHSSCSIPKPALPVALPHLNSRRRALLTLRYPLHVKQRAYHSVISGRTGNHRDLRRFIELIP